MGGQCDVYVYESSEGGITIYVASTRRRVKLPEFPPFKETTAKEILKIHKLRKKIAEEHPEADAIDSSYAGNTYHGLTLQEAFQLLEDMRLSGINVPDYAIMSLKEEYKEELQDG
jgi:hypothetical protein